MKIFITGAAGFVGAATARLAAEAGHQVIGIVRPHTALHRLQLKIEYLKIDLQDESSVQVALKNHQPDVLIHPAWSGVKGADRFDRRQFYDNVESSCRLVEMCAENGVKKWIGVGSQAEYGPLNRKISEDDAFNPTTLYGAAKVAAFYLTKQIAEQTNLSYAWLRLFSTYGPGDNPSWLIPSVIQQMKSGQRPQTTQGTQRWDYLYIDDVARGLLAVATHAEAKGAFNLGSGRPITVRSIIEKIRDQVAPKMELKFGEIPFRPDQVMHMEADISRLTSLTDWQPQVGIDEGLKLTIESVK